MALFANNVCCTLRRFFARDGYQCPVLNDPIPNSGAKKQRNRLHYFRLQDHPIFGEQQLSSPHTLALTPNWLCFQTDATYYYHTEKVPKPSPRGDEKHMNPQLLHHSNHKICTSQQSQRKRLQKRTLLENVRLACYLGWINIWKHLVPGGSSADTFIAAACSGLDRLVQLFKLFSYEVDAIIAHVGPYHMKTAAAHDLLDLQEMNNLLIDLILRTTAINPQQLECTRRAWMKHKLTGTHAPGRFADHKLTIKL